MGGQTNISISASTFQNFPKDFSKGYAGENFSTIGANFNYSKIPNWTIYTGLGVTVPDKTDVKNIDKGTSYSFIGDIKSSHKYYDGEYFSLSADSRCRFNLNCASQTLAVRFAPASINVPLNDKSSVYAVPYVLEKVDFNEELSFKSLKDNLRFACYAGIKRKFNIFGTDFTAFAEGQFYNLGKNVKDAVDNKPMDWSTVSFNAGVTIPLNFNKK